MLAEAKTIFDRLPQFHEPSRRTRVLLLSSLLVLSFTFKIFFVFLGSHYKEYLFSDMGAFWDHANARYEGAIFDINQWLAVPPFFHLMLFQLFKLAAFLGLYGRRLELIHVVFIFLSTFSIMGVYQIIKQMTERFWITFLAAAFYAFCYPVIYFNSFILSENLATPLLIVVIWIIFTFNGSISWMFTAGLLFGVTVATRPVFGLVGLFFYLFILFAGRFSWKSLLRSISFSVAFGIFLFLVIAENHYISKGQIRGISGCQGTNLFMHFCQSRTLISTYPGYGGMAVFTAPVFFEQYPGEYGVFRTDKPIHDNKFFLEKAKDCIRENPHIWIDNLKLLTSSFNGPLFPTRREVKGFSFWMPAFSILTIFLTLSIGLFYIVAPRNALWVGRMTVLLAPFFTTLLLSYFYITPEPRFLIPCLFGLYIVFFSLLPRLFQFWRTAAIYYAILILIFGLVGMENQRQREISQKVFGVEKIKMYPLERVSRRKPNGTPGDEMGLFLIPTLKHAILLRAEKPRSAHTIEISTDSGDSYQLQFYLDGKHRGDLTLAAVLPAGGGTLARILEMPAALRGQTFNQILVRPLQGDGTYSLAYLVLEPANS